MLSVEAAMRSYARKWGEDETTWCIVGLLHDFDYERWPDPPDHPLQGAAILADRGYPPLATPPGSTTRSAGHPRRTYRLRLRMRHLEMKRCQLLA